MTRLLETMLALGLTLASLPGPVEATPPCECLSMSVLPPPGAVDVPVNVRIFVPQGGFVAEDVRLAPDGDSSRAVPVRVEGTSGTQGELWLVPTVELEPDTAYRLVLPVPPGTMTFTTGPDTDLAAPRLSRAEILSGGGLDGACADYVSAELLVDGLVDDRVAARNLLLRVTVNTASGDDTVRTVFLPGRGGPLGTFTDPSWQSCLNNFADADPDATYRATVTAVDWSGNQSVSAQSGVFYFDRQGASVGCMCSAPGGRPSSTGGLVLVIAGVLVVLLRHVLANVLVVLFRRYPFRRS